MTLCRRYAALGSEFRKRPFGFYGKGKYLFQKKKLKKNPGRSIFFFSGKNIQDRPNAIVRFVLSWSNMSKVLYGNKISF